jgi:tRNA nucleotidyltransferase (CCA-adding enzyme)
MCYNYIALGDVGMKITLPVDYNLSSSLLQALKPEKDIWLHLVLEEATRKNIPLYIIGGFVRDLLLGVPALDFDLVLEGDAISFVKSLAKRHGGKVTSHKHFMTATWRMDRNALAQLNILNTNLPKFPMLDFISARAEIYKHPAALPTVFPGTISDDIHRRDFTINTLAIRLDGGHLGEFCDIVGGLKDLESGIIRVLHPRSFVDDPTRIFRAVRYAQRYDFEIAAETQALIPESLLLFDKLSAKRLRHELDLIFDEPKAIPMLAQLAGLGILPAVNSDLEWNRTIQKRLGKIPKNSTDIRLPLSWIFWLMDLSPEAIRGVENRLHFPASLRNNIQAAAALSAESGSLKRMKPSQCVAVLEKYPQLVIQAFYSAATCDAVRNKIKNYMETWKHIKPITTGHRLKQLGLAPGPKYREILQRLKDAWLDGEVSSEEEENNLLELLL